jgi:hypothetical protein
MCGVIIPFEKLGAKKNSAQKREEGLDVGAAVPRVKPLAE